MGDAVLSGFLPMLFEKLASLAKEEIGLLWNFNDELDNLRSTLRTIQGVLVDAENRQSKDKALRDWLGMLKDAAYDADDMLDEFATEALRRQVEIQDCVGFLDRLANKVRNLLSSSSVIFRIRMGRKIKKIKKRLEDIAGEMPKFNLREVLEDNERETHSFVPASKVYGREGDNATIQAFLTDKNSEEDDVSIICIVGMGALGKTTLAQLVYNTLSDENYFDTRLWVCVSDRYFDVKRIAGQILQSATKEESSHLSMDLLQSRLRTVLDKKKYLLVLDDVWNEDHEKWAKLKTLLSCGEKGSKIIVTTRNEKVAMIMGTVLPHKLEGLSEDHCWTIFKERAFGEGRLEETTDLVAIGKEIVKNCRGVPLAAKALGSLMHFKYKEHEWLSIKESDIWKSSEDETIIFSVLRLSYDHLPSYLKQCFVYCAIFPKDHEIEKHKLIQLWMAEGFLQPCTGSQIVMEDIGSRYFNDLMWRSFFQDEERDDFGNITKCKMHGLVRDLAKSIAGTEYSMVKGKETDNILKIIRHSSLDCEIEVSLMDLEALQKAKKLHTSLLFGQTIYRKVVPYNIFFSFKFLRVLDLRWTNIKKLPFSIGYLRHLRYLDLSETDIETFPETISSLCNLQTLKLSNCRFLRELPKDMRKMVSLRHIEIKISQPSCRRTSIGRLVPFETVRLTKMPAGIGRLHYLQTLEIFVVSKESGCGIEELKDLNLRGYLKIEKLENVKNATDANKSNLKWKPNLHLLYLSWSNDVDAYNTLDNDGNILEGLQPHTNLRRFGIFNYNGFKFSSWMVDHSLLPNLVEIRLVRCRKCKHLPPLGLLRFLKVLIMEELDDVKYMINESYGKESVKQLFPSLEILHLLSMPNLEAWSVEVGGGGRLLFPCLSSLWINECSKLTTLPQLDPLSLTYLRLVGTNVSLSSLSNFTSVLYLGIGGFLDMESLPKDLLRKHIILKSLEISKFPKLKSLSKELDFLTTLEELNIENCDEVEALLAGLQNVPFKILRITRCNKLFSLLGDEVRGLTSITTLTIRSCENLQFLGEGLKNQDALQYLYICTCPQLETLPESLGTPISLFVEDCPSLTCLPASIEGLTSLRYLSISGCPQLEKRCEKGRGEDWDKIAHIPLIEIGGLRV
ncbi:putative disease resistance protein RGA4 [Tasmannia lanceolata]|uniref:putative disease resistance protein RGA4 n=1 Tax=Tasmannia lanceolata TaxID=3420 RepID=UPI00406479BC